MVKTSEALKDAYENGFELFEIKESNVSELFGIVDADEPKYFEAKFVIVEQDDSGKVKNHKQTVLVQSDDMRSAYNTFIESMKGTMVDYTEVGLKEAPGSGPEQADRVRESRTRRAEQETDRAERQAR